MPPPSAPAAVPSLTLVLGDEELLVEREVARVVAAVRAGDLAAEVSDLPLAQLAAGQLRMLLSPSLFGGRHVAVLRDAQDAGKDAVAELTRTLPPGEDDALVVTHAGGAKGRALVDALTAAGARVTRCERIVTTTARADFVVAEVRRAGGRVAAHAAAELVAAVGSDLRELATASEQLVADTGGTVDVAAVLRYYRGRPDASGFAVADRAVEGDVAGAVELLRWALDTGVAPVLVTSSLAANLRLIARVAGEGRAPAARIAKTVGQPTWKVEKSLRWSRGWSPPALAAAVRAVATADAEVKGGAADSAYAVERAVLTVATARRTR